MIAASAAYANRNRVSKQMVVMGDERDPARGHDGSPDNPSSPAPVSIIEYFAERGVASSMVAL